MLLQWQFVTALTSQFLQALKKTWLAQPEPLIRNFFFYVVLNYFLFSGFLILQQLILTQLILLFFWLKTIGHYTRIWHIRWPECIYSALTSGLLCNNNCERVYSERCRMQTSYKYIYYGWTLVLVLGHLPTWSTEVAILFNIRFWCSDVVDNDDNDENDDNNN